MFALNFISSGFYPSNVQRSYNILFKIKINMYVIRIPVQVMLAICSNTFCSFQQIRWFAERVEVTKPEGTQETSMNVMEGKKGEKLMHVLAIIVNN